MRNYRLYWVFILVLILACTEEAAESAESPTSGSITIGAEPGLYFLVEELVSTFEGIYPGADIKTRYAPSDALQAWLREDSLRLIIDSRELEATVQGYFDSIHLTVDPLLLGVEQLWYFGAKTREDSLLCWQDLERYVEAASSQKQAFLIPGYPHRPAGLVEWLQQSYGIQPGERAAPIAFPPFAGLDSLLAHYPEAWGLVGSSQWLLSPAVDKETFANSCRWLFFQPCGEGRPEEELQLKLQTRPILLLSRDRRRGLGYGFAAYLSSKAGQRLLEKSGLVSAQQYKRVVEVRPVF